MKEMEIKRPPAGQTLEEYLAVLESALFDPSNKRVSMRAQGMDINMLVDVAARFRDLHDKQVNIENISTGTIKGLTVKKDTAKNVSWMKIVLVKVDRVRE
jgi:DNA-binding protein Alba